jgi:hypothetical protein
VSGADVDFDGRQEILVAPRSGRPDEVLAFEADGTPVAGFVAIAPFAGAVTTGSPIGGTDRFVKK